MDDKPSEEKSPDAAIVGVTPDMRVGAGDKLAEPWSAVAHEPAKRRRRMRAGGLLTGAAALVGLAALMTSAWVYTDMQREMRRVSTEVAQLRLSLDLYAQRVTAPVGAVVPGDAAALAALESRLALLEQNWRGAGNAQPAALPAISGPAASSETDGDCLPSGMLLLVAAGDSYKVCGTDATIEVMNVSDGYIALADGTTVPSGGTVPLNGTACRISVTSGGDEAVTGFAEIRVGC